MRYETNKLYRIHGGFVYIFKITNIKVLYCYYSFENGKMIARDISSDTFDGIELEESNMEYKYSFIRSSFNVHT